MTKDELDVFLMPSFKQNMGICSIYEHWGPCLFSPHYLLKLILLINLTWPVLTGIRIGNLGAISFCHCTAGMANYGT